MFGKYAGLFLRETNYETREVPIATQDQPPSDYENISNSFNIVSQSIAQRKFKQFRLDQSRSFCGGRLLDSSRVSVFVFDLQNKQV